MSYRPSIPPEDRYGNTRGQSYRPGNRSPIPSEAGSSGRPQYRARSPAGSVSRGINDGTPYGPPRDRIDRALPPRTRSRSPPPFRRRSRSPIGQAFRERVGDTFRARPRSPIRGPLERDNTTRNPPYREPNRPSNVWYKDGPRPRDARPPLSGNNTRDVSPRSARGRFSPPNIDRDRFEASSRQQPEDRTMVRERSPPRRRFSPTGDRRYSPAPRRPPRDDRPGSKSPRYRSDFPERSGNYSRRSSQSPRRGGTSASNSGRESGTTSRRSSPTGQNSGRNTNSNDERSRNVYTNKSSNVISRPRSPSRQGQSSTNHQQPATSQVNITTSGNTAREISRTSTSISQSYRNDPVAASNTSTPVAPRTDPTQSNSNSRVVATTSPIGRDEQPSGPRGRPSISGFTSYRENTSNYLSRDNTPNYASRDNTSSYATRDTANPPSGPRIGSGVSSSIATGFDRASSFSSSAPTQPKLQRSYISTEAPSYSGITVSNTTSSRQPSTASYLASLPTILDEGKKLPDLYDRTRLDKLQADNERLYKISDEKQARKRRMLREWEKLQREVEHADLRSVLAHESLDKLAGETSMAAAF